VGGLLAETGIVTLTTTPSPPSYISVLFTMRTGGLGEKRPNCAANQSHPPNVEFKNKLIY
jgi:hypothetical protein